MPDDSLQGLDGDARIVAEAKKRFNYCASWEGDARKRFLEDLKFANADPDNNWQWDDELRTYRQDRNKPCLTINKTRQHNLQIINDAKQNKPGVNVRPTGGGATYDAAQVFEGIVRHIEYISNAEVAYDTATTFQVEGGIGYWRVVTEYVSDDSFDQDIFIKRIKQPLSVYLDPDISEVDGSDARYGFIFEDMPRDEFNKEYPRFKDDGGMSVLGGAGDDWIDEEHIRVAEYYSRDQKRRTLVAYADPASGQQVVGQLEDMTPDRRQFVEALKKSGDGVVDEREILTDEINWYKIAGSKIIDRRRWLGRYIPIVRIIGEETIIEGKLDRKGHTRAMKDAQRMYNYWPLSLDTPIPTPNGWTTMGDIEVGDMIFDVDGKPTRVRGMSEIFHDRKCYRVTFDDGTSIVADAEHPWVVEERGKRQSRTWDWQRKKLTTAELVPDKHFIEVAKPLEGDNTALPVDPYFLGVWLGDGRSNGGEICAGHDDAQAMFDNLRASGVDVRLPIRAAQATRIPVHGVIGKLKALGVANNKHIPLSYLRASAEHRVALLQGLMDTDGGINSKTRQCSFDNSNPVLFANVLELVRSLGIKARARKISAGSRLFPSGKVYACQPSERLTFSTDQMVFRLPRKASVLLSAKTRHWRRTKRFAIKSLVEVPSVPVRCVSIESESHLFLAGPSMVPTHNTSEATAQVALQTKTPWLAPVEAIEGQEEYWGRSNLDEVSVLPHNAYTEDGHPIPAPQRTEPAVMASAYVQGLQITQNELMMASGQYQSQFGQNENATSGKAINERQRQGDNATYHFIDNLGIGIRYTGRILIDLIPKIYDTPRVIRIMAQDGTQTHVRLDPDAPQAYQSVDSDAAAEIAAIFNPNVGRYEVESDVGPGYATRRQEAFNAMTQIAAQNKEFMQVAGDLMWKVADFPYADELAERWAKTIPESIKGDGPSPQEQQMMQHVQQLQDAVVELQQKLNDKQIDYAIRIDQKNIDAFDADTKRLTAEGNAGPYVTPEQIQPLIVSTIMAMLRGGDASGNSAPVMGVPATTAVPQPTEPQGPVVAPVTPQTA